MKVKKCREISNRIYAGILGLSLGYLTTFAGAFHKSYVEENEIEKSFNPEAYEQVHDKMSEYYSENAKNLTEKDKNIIKQIDNFYRSKKNYSNETEISVDLFIFYYKIHYFILM